jgi:hypothetical protein
MPEFLDIQSTQKCAYELCLSTTIENDINGLCLLSTCMHACMLVSLVSLTYHEQPMLSISLG